MRIKVILFIVASSVAACAFSSSEVEQSSAINEKYFRQMEEARAKLDHAINNQVDNNPEKKALIIALKDAWEKTTYYKCQLESFDSLRTQAESAEISDCLTHQYLTETEYFTHLLP